MIVSKVGDHLPVHGQGKILERFGVPIPDQTMCGWMWPSAELLEPLYGRLKGFVLSLKVTGTDDTPIRVLDKSLDGTARKGRFWRYVGTGVIRSWRSTIRQRESALGPESFSKTSKAICKPVVFM